MKGTTNGNAYESGKFVHAYEKGEMPQLELPSGLLLPVKRLPVVATQNNYLNHVLDLYLGQLEDFEIKRFAASIGRDAALQRAQQNLLQLLDYIRDAGGWPTIAGLGTHRDKAVREPVKRIIEHIANYAVHAGIGLTHGHLHYGNMRWFREYWLRARSRYKPGRIWVGGVPLWVEGPDMEWERRDPPAHWIRYGPDDAVSPPHATLETRFPTIVGVTESLASLYATGGRGRNEELTRDLLARQHARKSSTWYTRRPDACFPLFVLLDFYMEDLGFWYWDPFIQEQVRDLSIAAISKEDCKDILVIRVGKRESPKWSKTFPIEVHYFKNPVFAGKYVVQRALQKYLDLRKGYQALLQ